MLIKLALQSLLNRKGSVLLTFLAMTVSISVLLGVEQLRHQAKHSFSSAISGVDLVVGAKTSQMNLLLYSVFRIGSPTASIRWQSYEDIQAMASVKWAIPISLGDSHQGFRVLGTTQDYFQHYQYADRQPLSFAQGHAFNDTYDVVLGAQVAKQLGYTLGDKIILSHGIAQKSFTQHDDSPFSITGILAPTGTPIDDTLHVSLIGIEAIHQGFQNGIQLPPHLAARLPKKPLKPKAITAVMVGLESRLAIFKTQQDINKYRKEPLLAILPGVAVSELWAMMGNIEQLLWLISCLVFIAALLGLSAMLLASIRERNHEIALLRTIGAKPLYMLLLIEAETLWLTLASIGSSLLLLSAIQSFAADYSLAQFGLRLDMSLWSLSNAYLLLAIVIAAIIAGAIPSFRAVWVARG